MFHISAKPENDEYIITQHPVIIDADHDHDHSFSAKHEVYMKLYNRIYRRVYAKIMGLFSDK